MKELDIENLLNILNQLDDTDLDMRLYFTKKELMEGINRIHQILLQIYK